MYALTSYEFEVAAKNAVIKMIDDEYGEQYDISGIQMVWYGHIMGFKKAILIDVGENNRMYEVTYDRDRDFMYVDGYVKKCKRELHTLDTIVH